MKKALLSLFLLFSSYFALAQSEQSQHQLFIGNSVINFANEDNNLKVQMQVGNPIIGTYSDTNINTSIGFPFGVLYVSPTFVVNGFEVSKGYFSDRIRISWELGANIDVIEKIRISRRELGSGLEKELIATVSKDVFEYNDTEVEGGVLYEYEVFAVGVSAVSKEPYINYMEGIGFRNPTAMVTGSVSYDGGSPVKDVVVFAEASGAESNEISGTGTSLAISDGYIAVNKIRYAIPVEKITLQAWVNNYGDVFKYTTSDGKTVELLVGKTNENEIKFILKVSQSISREITLKDAYPTGELDPFGNDVFASVSSLSNLVNNKFIHVTCVLEANKFPKFYVNGREITEDYINSRSDYIEKENLENGTSNPVPSLPVDLSIVPYNNFNSAVVVNKIILAEDYTGNLDEVRIWQKTLSDQEIRRDYRRYLSGSEPSMALYFRFDEEKGSFSYDLSKKGFRQNKNDGSFVLNTANGIQFSDFVPQKKQLGVFGVTDNNGSYTISSIAYSGTGESFIITPSLGVHEFEPSSQTLFLGAAESVVNQLNFTDKSSFTFNGKAVYNVQNVFSPIDLTSEESSYTDIEDFSYNKYRVKDVNGSFVVINKGQYYYEGGSINPANGFYEGGALKKYPVIGLDKANVYVDDVIVIDDTNQPVLTDANGDFQIQVPIGKHKIELRKDGHTFAYSGYFPATNTFDFFENQLDPSWFIDTTRISLIGKVVGGKKEFEKPLGFGLEGAFSYTNYEDEESEESELISTKNNIGVANIILKGGSLDTNNLNVPVITNQTTGEYKVSLIPYIYYIKKEDLTIPSNSDISILTSNETLNLMSTPKLDSISYTTKDGAELYSKPFHHKKSFRYNAPVSVELISQQYEKSIKVGAISYDISHLETPIYTQKKDYEIVFEVSQNYVNKDGEKEVITKEFYTDGAFNITNNLSISGSEKIALINNNSQYKYSFKTGEANTTHSDGFKKSISVQYVITGSDPLTIQNSGDFKSSGIINGGAATAGVSYATMAPDVPDIILRDPPGSNSFASIASGTSISYSESKTAAESDSNGGGLLISVGPTFESELGSGFFNVTTEVETIANAESGISKTVESVSNEETSNTYTFNQTISTSSDPSYVGANGDLYIGNSKNIYYGLFSKINVTEAPITLPDSTEPPYITITAKDSDGADKTLYISTRKEVYIAEQPTSTFFMYSQFYILNTLIPELETLANNFVPDPESDILITAQHYRNQADLWKRVIQENEKSKYKAKNNLEASRSIALTQADNYGANSTALRALINQHFFSNKSFDAGLGEFTSSVEVARLTASSYETSIEISEDFKSEIGVLVNNVGAVGNYTSSKNEVDSESVSSESGGTTEISYTLQDNDSSNSLSIDVVNLFDGNGPIFITRGGATSCPYEGETTSNFYNNTTYNASIVGSGGEALNFATNRVYATELETNKNIASNVPENIGAAFMLSLKNKSETQSNLMYVLEVDPLTLNGATTNIPAGGLEVFLPYDTTYQLPFEVYKSSASSVYDYENIKVYLKNACDTSSTSEVSLTVNFKPSCSQVTVSYPENNWVFNNSEAYKIDVNGNKINNKLPITFTDFNTSFNGFKKIELQYRNGSSANWIKFQTYYGSNDIKDEYGDENGIVIAESDSEFTYNWDVIGDKIPDGNYEFRAISYCTDEVTFVSDIISGTINLSAPLLFGTPAPSDGILDVGEDISIRFNENIFKSVATSIKVTGLSNQQAVDHSVSIYLDGGLNQLELPNQILPKGSFTLQFWFKNATTGNGKLITQEDGVTATLDGNELTFSIGGGSVNAVIDGSQYNFYSLIYENGALPQLIILENGTELANKALNKPLDISSNKSILLGGENIKGNIHDVRFWSKTFTKAQATVAKDNTLSGNELNLIGYWPLDEGSGKAGLDKAKMKNAIINLNWAIFPKGTSYDFDNAPLSLTNVGFVQPSEQEDITMSFWIKTAFAQEGTIFSNGKGTQEDILQTNGFRNKWSINMKSDGNLELMSENISYDITSNSIADNNWHHVAFVIKRRANITTYIDGAEISAVSCINIGGISGDKILIGARLFKNLLLQETIDNSFKGSLDEIRLWNTARSLEQIKRDRFFEIDANSEGLLLYIDFNQEDGNIAKGPRYNHMAVNNTMGSTFSNLSDGKAQSYNQDSPALKPKLKFTNIPFSSVINGDEMIIEPELTKEEWALFENQILNFSVSKMVDTHFNEQPSPVSWSAFVKKQEIEWFTQEQTKEIIDKKNVGETYEFTMDIVNKGGSNQTFEITGIPTWLTTKSTRGSIAPNTTKKVVFTVDSELAVGTYNINLFLKTSSEFNDRLGVELRVLSAAPDWKINPKDFSSSLNIIGKIKINDQFSRDSYSKVGAFVNNEPRGEAYLAYDSNYDSYYVYLTVYSNSIANEEVTFKIWDASNDKVLVATINGTDKINYIQNEVIGNKKSPTIFSGDQSAEQIIPLNSGWTWFSIYVNDSNLSDVNDVFKDLNLTDNDLVKSGEQFTRYENGNWYGSLVSLPVTKMYKLKLANAGNLRLVGNDVDESNLDMTIVEGWNWLSFPIHRNISLEEALAFYIPSDGDVIKDQFNFAIYDSGYGWSGTLKYMQSDKGYMLKSGNAQTFRYPDSKYATSAKSARGKQTNLHSKEVISNFSKYGGNMSVVLKVLNNIKYSKVRIYDSNGILRGESPIVSVNGESMSFISVFSDENEMLHFAFSDGDNELNVDKDFLFENNKVYGDLVDPVVFNFEDLYFNENLLPNIILYPNPFSDSFTVDSTLEFEKLINIKIYTITGRLVKEIVEPNEVITLNNLNVPNGVYIVKLTSNTGTTAIRKMIKK